MPLPPRSIVVLLIAVLGLFSCQEKGTRASPPTPPPPQVSYNFEIRPILAQKCFGCHGRDHNANESGLRLDTAEFAFAPLSEGDPAPNRHAFLPGNREQSVAWLRIHSEDPEKLMPPPDSRIPLTEDEKDLLGRWIDQGAKYEPHWAFQTLPAEVPVPAVSASGWPVGKIDRFVLATLEKNGLLPSPQADPSTLHRRLSLALTGRALPSAQHASYQQKVDTLLESDAFAEHFATIWLEAIGYADTLAPESSQLTSRWVYRDWVIKNGSLNHDQFLTAQLAGDLEFTGDLNRSIATAFNRLHSEAPSRAAHLAPILGLSLECARCHDHKSEPISHHDFQSLTAFFTGSGEGKRPTHPSIVPAPTKLLPTEDQIQLLLTVRGTANTALTNLRVASSQGEDAFQSWLQEPLKTPLINDALGTFTFDGRKGVVPNQALSGSGSGDATGLIFTPGFSRHAVTISDKAGVTFSDFFPARRWTPWSFTLRLRVPDNPNPSAVLLSRGRGSDDNLRGFDLVLEQGRLTARISREWPGKAIAIRTVAPVIGTNHWHLITWTYDGSSAAEGLVLYLDGKRIPTEVIADALWKPVFFAEEKSLPLQLGWRENATGFAGGAIDDFQVHTRALSPLEVATLFDGNSLSSTLEKPNEHLPALRSYYFSSLHSESRTRRTELAEARMASILPEEDILEVSVMQGSPTSRPTMPSFLAQGSGTIDPGVPQKTLDRSDLAQAIIEHPLTARVFVNRVWAHFFGRGLLETTNDFGMHSPAPSHPELLDWLARDLVDHNWNVKRMSRQIVLSATFRQDATLRPEVSILDPRFRLLAQGPSFSLSAPQFRDFFLHAAGLLDSTGAGDPPSSESTRPFRRSIYQLQHYPSPRALAESPSEDRCPINYFEPAPLAPRPGLTAQEFFLASRALATLLLTEHSQDAERAQAIYLRLIGRTPTAAESTELLAELESQRARVSSDDPDAPKLVQPQGSTIEVIELSAWSGLIESEFIQQRASRQR